MKTTIPSTQPARKYGSGEYKAEAVVMRSEDLPKPKILKEDRNASHRPCPNFGKAARREHVYHRRLHDVGDLVSGRPVELSITYSQHHCQACNKYFMTDLSAVAPLGSHYTHRVIGLAVRVVVEDGLAYRNASWHLWRDHRVFVPFATIQNWVEAGGKKGQRASPNSGGHTGSQEYENHVAQTPSPILQAHPEVCGNGWRSFDGTLQSRPDSRA